MQTRKDTIQETFAWDAARAVIIGLVLRTSFSLSPEATLAVPLFDWIASPVIKSLIGLVVFTLIVVLILAPFRRIFYLIFAAGVLYMWCFYYSSRGAFHIHVALVCLFGFLAESSAPKARQAHAAMFAAAVFFTAAFWKINSNFLSGEEFLPKGDFFNYIYRFSPAHKWLSDQPLVEYFPVFSILTELFLGTLALVNFSVGGHLILIFLLALSILHPMVIFVYFCFLPMVIVADPSMLDRIRDGRLSAVATSPFFWLFSISFCNRFMGAVEYPADLVLLVLAIAGIHVHLLWRKLNSKAPFALLPQLRPIYLTMPAIIVILVILRLLGAPSALAYDMFAARRQHSPVHRIRIEDGQLCRKLNSLFANSRATDFSISHGADRECEVSFATKDGIDFVKRNLCRKELYAQWDYRPRDGIKWTMENCASLNDP